MYEVTQVTVSVENSFIYYTKPKLWVNYKEIREFLIDQHSSWIISYPQRNVPFDYRSSTRHQQSRDEHMVRILRQ